MKKFLIPALLSILFFASCKKDKTTQEISVEAKLIGKWNLKSFVYYDNTQWQTSTYPPGQYLVFENGGKLTAKVDNAISYSTWDLLDDNKTLFVLDNGVLDVPDNGYEIKTLTNTSLVLYANEAGGTTQQGITINLEK